MQRSRKALFGLLALAVVTVVGATSCSSPDLEGWHFIGTTAPTFTDGKGCTFQLRQRNVAAGSQVYIVDVNGTCASQLAEVSVRRVSCYYMASDLSISIQILDTDTCPTKAPTGSGTLVYINQGYSQPVLPPT